MSDLYGFVIWIESVCNPYRMCLDLVDLASVA